MTLLRQIQADLSAADVDVAVVLRKCKILARRLKSPELGKWVTHELDGYPPDVEVPAYRIVRPHHFASFSNGYWHLPNQPVSPHIIDKKWRSIFEPHPFGEGIEAVKALAVNGGSVMRNELRFLLKGKIADLPCYSFYSNTPAMQFQQILAAVTSRVLDFVMDIEEENPDAGEALTTETPIPADRVQQLINNHFHGPVGNVAQLSSSVSQTATINVTELAELMTRTRAELEAATLDNDVRAAATAQVATIEAQLSAPSPNDGIIREAGRSLRTIIEGTIANVAADPSKWLPIIASLATLSG